MPPPPSELQADFAAAILDPARPVPQGVTAPGGGRVIKRFNVYRNNVVVSLREALASAYPTIRKLVGPQNFDGLAGVYVRAHPPSSALMTFYGEAFPDFLETLDPLRKFPYLPDVARLERARREVYHAADATPDDGSCLGALPQDRLGEARLDLIPALRVLRSAHPVFSIWRYNNVEEFRITAPREDVLVARPEMTLDMRALPPGAWAFISALAAGETLGEAAEAGAADAPEFDLAANIGGLLETRILAGARLDD